MKIIVLIANNVRPLGGGEFQITASCWKLSPLSPLIILKYISLEVVPDHPLKEAEKNLLDFIFFLVVYCQLTPPLPDTHTPKYEKVCLTTMLTKVAKHLSCALRLDSVYLAGLFKLEVGLVTQLVGQGNVCGFKPKWLYIIFSPPNHLLSPWEESTSK